MAGVSASGRDFLLHPLQGAQIAGKSGARQALNGHFRALKTGEGKRLEPVMLLDNDGWWFAVAKRARGLKHAASAGRQDAV